ncbi:MAG: DeoR/GlpR family DNA-binding transcription regulator [Acidobacteriota bacterium]|nr:DeoR/GlpR family DNA-binding transcription regulator [Acidobacteriota bacterium]
MDAPERLSLILNLARDRGRVDVSSLAPELGVAPETVRRDLSTLVSRGLLRRVHGGAIPAESTAFETDARYRAQANVAQKRRIAAASARLLAGAESVFIDEGFTPMLVAEELSVLGRLVIVTASLPAALALSNDPDATVLVLGGRMRGRTSATVDHWAVRMLEEMWIDIAFLGANGISCDRGVTTPDPAVAAVKREAVQRSRRRILIGDHAKFGMISFCRFAEVSEFETIVTDTGLSTREASRYEALGPRVIRV